METILLTITIIQGIVICYNYYQNRLLKKDNETNKLNVNFVRKQILDMRESVNGLTDKFFRG